SRGGGYTSENLVMISNYVITKLGESSVVVTSSIDNLKIVKEYQVSDSTLKTTYYLSGSSGSNELLLTEMAFSPYSLNELRLEVGGEVIETGRYVETDEFMVVSESNVLKVRLSEVASLWGWKQVTLSRTEKGVKESLQGLMIALGLKIKDLTREYFQITLHVT
ncbi:MAG: hypothetical protein ACK416_00475, partial [Zestosphaera sp.]